MSSRSIGGNWRGHYDYKKIPDEGSGFEALLIEGDGSLFYGHILDDFWPGKATLTGSFEFPSVRFTKTYVLQMPGLMPIDYEGTMSDDGKSMSGTWTIMESTGPWRGSWAAYRLDEEEKKADEAKQSKVRELDEVEGR